MLGGQEGRQRTEPRKQRAATSSQGSSKCKGLRKEIVLEDWPSTDVFTSTQLEPRGLKVLVITTEYETKFCWRGVTKGPRGADVLMVQAKQVQGPYKPTTGDLKLGWAITLPLGFWHPHLQMLNKQWMLIVLRRANNT